MFNRKDTVCQCFSCVARQDWDRRLLDDLSIIDARADPMDGTASLGIARIYRALMRVETFIFRQEGGVNIDHPTFPRVCEPGCQDAHEAGQRDDFYAGRFKVFIHSPLERFAVLAEGFVINCSGWDSLVGGCFQPRACAP